MPDILNSKYSGKKHHFIHLRYTYIFFLCPLHDLSHGHMISCNHPIWQAALRILSMKTQINNHSHVGSVSIDSEVYVTISEREYFYNLGRIIL